MMTGMHTRMRVLPLATISALAAASCILPGCGRVPSAASQSNSVTDPRNLPTLVRTIYLPGVEGRIDHMAYDPESKRLFIAALGNGSLEVVDVEKGAPVKSIGGLKEPQSVVFVPASNHVVVSNGGDGTVRAF